MVVGPLMERTLQDSWYRCWLGIGAQGEGTPLMKKLIAAYEEPQRKYHTLQHLTESLSLLSRYLNLAVEPAEVEIALWFHDSIYDVMAHDNEARSAAWAAESLSNAGVAGDHIEKVHQHILATRHSALPIGQDQQLLVDIDLAILGAARSRFDEYEVQVREEYAWVPEPLFRQKRAEVLDGFLARYPIYNTAALRESFEHQARENLIYSIQKLRGGG